MNLIAYPPVFNAKRIRPLPRYTPPAPLPKREKKCPLIDRATRTQLAAEHMNHLGFKAFRSRFMPAPMLEIVKKVAHERNISMMLMAGKSRKRVAVQARNEAMYLIKQVRPTLPMSRFAQWFDRDHTSAMHGIASHATKSGLPQLVGYDLARVRRRNAKIAAQIRASQNTMTRSGGRG